MLEFIAGVAVTAFLWWFHFELWRLEQTQYESIIAELEQTVDLWKRNAQRAYQESLWPPSS